MVIQDAQWMDTLPLDFDWTFEVELPQLVGLGSLEPLNVGLMPLGSSNTPVTLEDGVDRPDGGDGQATIAKDGMNLGSSPIIAISDFQDVLYDRLVGSPWRDSGATWSIFQRLGRRLLETIKPFVGGLPRDTKLSASLGDRGDLI